MYREIFTCLFSTHCLSWKCTHIEPLWQKLIMTTSSLKQNLISIRQCIHILIRMQFINTFRKYIVVMNPWNLSPRIKCSPHDTDIFLKVLLKTLCTLNDSNVGHLLSSFELFGMIWYFIPDMHYGTLAFFFMTNCTKYAQFLQTILQNGKRNHDSCK